MRIIKAYKSSYRYSHYYIMVDEKPELTYEYEQGSKNLIGSALDKDGNIIFSSYLKYEYIPRAQAFGGRELKLTMKDGSINTIKDRWWDNGPYKSHGSFTNVGMLTLDEYYKSNCYVYYSTNINIATLEKLLDEYLLTDTFHEYGDIRKWLYWQNKVWFRVYAGETKLPLLIDSSGKHFVDLETHTPVYCSRHIRTRLNIHEAGKIFYYEYRDPVSNRLYKIERSLKDILKDSKAHDIRNYIKE